MDKKLHGIDLVWVLKMLSVLEIWESEWFLIEDAEDVLKIMSTRLRYPSPVQQTALAERTSNRLQINYDLREKGEVPVYELHFPCLYFLVITLFYFEKWVH